VIDLTKREKRLVMILAIFLGLVFIYFVIITPLIGWREQRKKDSESNLTKLNTLEKIYEQYRDTREKTSQYSAQLNNTKGLTSIIEENAQGLDILKNKAYTRDRPTIVQGKYKKISADVKFESIDIISLLNFIYRMENSGILVQVSYLRLNQAIKGRNTYDATITFNSLTSQ
jgi:type II secretory pathway component PulM